MDTYDTSGMQLGVVEPGTNANYSLTLGTGSEIGSTAADLVSIGETGDGDLSGDTTKDLPLLIIQERLEEPAALPESEAVTYRYSKDKLVADTNDSELSPEEDCTLKLDGEDEISECQKLVIVNGLENTEDNTLNDQSAQQTGYYLYTGDAGDQALQMTNPNVTPLLVLANNSQKGMYEANVVFGQSDSPCAPEVNEDSNPVAVQPQVDFQAAAESGTITMTVDANAQLLLGSQPNTGQLLYICDNNGCGAAFGSLEQFNQHQICHTNGIANILKEVEQQGMHSKMLVCRYEGCNRTFSWPTHLKYHELTHTGKRMFQCDYENCGASFYTVQRLTVHQRTHTGEKPFPCTEPNCGKAFTTQGNLKNHLRVHSGERPYACDFPGCSRRFAEHSSLRKHLLVHTGTKPYSCDLCGKRFSQSGSRNVHMKRHQVLSETREEVVVNHADVTSAAAVTPESATSMMVKLPNDKVLILQHAQNQVFSGFAESVVYSNAVPDHVVTVTTEPTDGENNGNEPDLPEPDDHVPSSSSANVVVLSQPEEMVAMAPGYHHTGEDVSKDMVYTCQQLLNSDVS